MKKLSVEFIYCYGINRLNYAFNFSDELKTYSIYAPNGSMKTSFSNAFYDHSQGLKSKDLIFGDRETKRSIIEEGKGELDSKQVFVIEPYNKEYASEKTSTLLVNNELKKKYDDIWNEIEKLQENLTKSLKKPSGLSKGIAEELSNTVMSAPNKLNIAIKRVKDEVLDGKDPVLHEVKYKVIFNDKVLKFLDDDEVKKDLHQYIERYDELIEKSSYFRKGIFNHTNASTIAKSLVANGFFEASHSVSLSDEDQSEKKITSEKELEQVIQKEMEEILKDEKLLKAFEKIDTKLKNQELKDLREYLVVHKELIPELTNIGYFKNKIWVDYLKLCKDQYRQLLDTYEKAEKKLEEIREQANKERTQWEQVVTTFNERFSVPFNLLIENQDDVILQGVLPALVFEFEDKVENKKKKVEKDDLIRVLSNGEKKALYILNILFEIEARKSEDKETLLIIDDIADSFDYKNKYAIIEYLKDNVDHKNFYQIILTHNFDFFRTIESRFPIHRDCCLVVDKQDDHIELEKAEYIRDPFRNFLENVKDEIKFLALIPFIRNLIQYTKGVHDPDFLLTTSVLHQKADTSSITKKQINDIMDTLFPNKKIKLDNPEKIILDLFIEKADELLGSSENLMLQNKIVLSIAIRLKAEEYMIRKIKDSDFVKGIEKNQTKQLVDKFIEENGSNSKEASTLKRVNLITPQNIHLNSFMYEPILDMSDIELKDLYKAVSLLPKD